MDIDATHHAMTDQAGRFLGVLPATIVSDQPRPGVGAVGQPGKTSVSSFKVLDPEQKAARFAIASFPFEQ
jgi:hypothetical protein